MKARLDHRAWMEKYGQWAVIFVLTLVFLAVQSGRLASPPWNEEESWRQTDTYSMARNFVSFDMNPLRPQLNYDGTGDNYSQLELQIVPYISALIFRLTGTASPAVCRVLSLMFFLGSAIFLYLLMRDFTGALPALFGYGVYLFLRLSLVMASSIQPEACALFFYCGGVYFLRRFQLTGKYRCLAAASAMTAAAIMEKTPVVFVGLLFLYVLVSVMGKGFYKNPWFYACGAITLLPDVLLMAYTSRHSVFRFVDGIATKHIFSGRILSLFTREGLYFFYEALPVNLGWAAIVLAVLGAMLIFRREYRFVLVWAVAFALECATIVAAIKFYSYLVFILPVCAMLAAMAVRDLGEHRRSLVAAACVFTVFSFWTGERNIWRPSDEAEIIGGTGRFIGENTDFYDPIAVGRMNPAYINAADRRGFRANLKYYEDIPDDPAGELEYFASHGVRWMVVVQGYIEGDDDGSYLDCLRENYPLYASGDYCEIYDLRSEAGEGT